MGRNLRIVLIVWSVLLVISIAGQVINRHQKCAPFWSFFEKTEVR